MALTQQQQEQATRVHAATRRAAIARLLRETMRRAHDFRFRQDHFKGLEGQVMELDKNNRRFREIDPTERTKFVIIALVALAAYTLDLALYRPVAQFVAGHGIPSWLKWFFTFALPAVLLAFELHCSAQRSHFRDAVSYEPARRGYLVFWTAISLLTTLVIPAAVVSTFLASFQELSPEVRIALLASLSLLALVSHAAIIWGGDLTIEAKTFVHYRLKRKMLQRRIDSEKRPLSRAQQRTRDAFAQYIQERDNFNATVALELQLGPPLIDTITIQALRDIYGREVIQTPTVDANFTTPQAPFSEVTSPPGSPVPSPNEGGKAHNSDGPGMNSGEPPAGSQTPPSAEGDTESSEVDYLRTVLTRRIREAEGELKP